MEAIRKLYQRLRARTWGRAAIRRTYAGLKKLRAENGDVIYAGVPMGEVKVQDLVVLALIDDVLSGRVKRGEVQTNYDCAARTNRAWAGVYKAAHDYWYHGLLGWGNELAADISMSSMVASAMLDMMASGAAQASVIRDCMRVAPAGHEELMRRIDETREAAYDECSDHPALWPDDYDPDDDLPWDPEIHGDLPDGPAGVSPETHPEIFG